MAANRARSPSVPFAIPPDSVLAVGWRGVLAALLLEHGLAEIMHAVSAYAELRVRHEPEDCSAREERAQGTWYRRPAKRQIDAKEEHLAAEKRKLPTVIHPRRIRGGKALDRYLADQKMNRLMDQYARGEI